MWFNGKSLEIYRLEVAVTLKKLPNVPKALYSRNGSDTTYPSSDPAVSGPHEMMYTESVY